MDWKKIIGNFLGLATKGTVSLDEHGTPTVDTEKLRELAPATQFNQDDELSFAGVLIGLDGATVELLDDWLQNTLGPNRRAAFKYFCIKFVKPSSMGDEAKEETKQKKAHLHDLLNQLGEQINLGTMDNLTVFAVNKGMFKPSEDDYLTLEQARQFLTATVRPALQTGADQLHNELQTGTNAVNDLNARLRRGDWF